MRNATRLADEIIQQKSFDDYRGEKLGPLNDEYDINNDDDVDNFIRNYSHSAYHPSCTLPMGKVVNEHGQLNGIENLRICDASIMPSMTSSNLNSPTIMIAEKISDHINGKDYLKPIDADVYIPKDWETKQR